MANNTRSLLVNVLKKMCRENMNIGLTEEAVDSMSFQALLDFFNENISVNLAEPSKDADGARQLTSNDGLSKIQQMNWSDMNKITEALTGAVFSLKNRPHDEAIALDPNLYFRVYDSFDNAKMLLDGTEKKITAVQNRIDKLSTEYESMMNNINAQPKPKKPGFFARLFNTSSNKKYNKYIADVKTAGQTERELKDCLTALDKYNEEKETKLLGDPREKALDGDNPEPVIVQEAPQKEVVPEAQKVNNGFNPEDVNIVEADENEEDIIDYDPDAEEYNEEPENEEEKDVVNEEPKVEEPKNNANEEPKVEEPKVVVEEPKNNVNEGPNDVVEEPKVVVEEPKNNVNEEPKGVVEEPKEGVKEESKEEVKEEQKNNNGFKLGDVNLEELDEEENDGPEQEDIELSSSDNIRDYFDKKPKNENFFEENPGLERKVIKKAPEIVKVGDIDKMDNAKEAPAPKQSENIKQEPEVKPAVNIKQEPEAKQAENIKQEPEVEQPLESEQVAETENSYSELGDAIITATVNKIKEITALNEKVYKNNNVLNQYLEDVKNVGIDVADFMDGKLTALNSEQVLNFAASAMLSEQLRSEHKSLNNGEEKGRMNTFTGSIEKLTERNGLANVEATKDALKAYKTLPVVKQLAEDMQNTPEVFIDLITEPEKVLNPLFNDVKKQYTQYRDEIDLQEKIKEAEEIARQKDIQANRDEHYGIYVYHDEKENKTVYLNDINRDIGPKEYKKIAQEAEARKEQIIKEQEARKAAEEFDEVVQQYEERRFEQELQRQNEMQDDDLGEELSNDEGAEIVLSETLAAADNIIQANEQLYNNNPVLSQLAEDMMQAGKQYASFVAGEEGEIDKELFVNLAASLILSEQLEDKTKRLDSRHTAELLNVYRRLPVVHQFADVMSEEIDTFIDVIKNPANNVRPMLKDVEKDLAQYGSELMQRQADERDMEDEVVEEEVEEVEKEIAPEKGGFSMHM